MSKKRSSNTRTIDSFFLPLPKRAASSHCTTSEPSLRSDVDNISNSEATFPDTSLLALEPTGSHANDEVSVGVAVSIPAEPSESTVPANLDNKMVGTNPESPLHDRDDVPYDIGNFLGKIRWHTKYQAFILLIS